MNKKRKILILGGGLAGLSAAYFLDKSLSYIVCEKEEKIGGLCRSYYQNGFIFDLTGHLIHLKNPEVMKLLFEELDIPFLSQKRKSAIFAYDRFIPYPFQVNLYALPKEIAYECLYEFIRKYYRRDKTAEKNFREWLLSLFGKGICKYFMFPYNEKIWGCNLSKITTEWVWSIPQPNLEDVLKGALGISEKQFGYNPIFYYPTHGGIETVPRTLANKLNNIFTNYECISIDYKNKIAKFSNGDEINYDVLINTIPLKQFLLNLENTPSIFKEYSERLKCVKVINFNIGVSRANITPYHWIYFPDKEYIFYRIGFPTNYCATIAPAKSTSMYIEISCKEKEKINLSYLREKVIEGLKKLNFISGEEEIISENVFIINPAYVIFDKRRSKILSRLKKFFAKNNIYLAGRFGNWDYSSMEDAIYEGYKLAKIINEANA